MAVKTYYSYALDANLILVEVHDAFKGGIYYCPTCGALTIPKQGKLKRWHFAHKSNEHECSYETYLHKLAKIRIRKKFLESENFWISYHPKTTCSVDDCPIGKSENCTWYSDSKKFDLKKFYDICEEEKAINGFVADLLLSSSEKPERPPVLIEICVTHESTETKIKSGMRIIELKISSEEDIDNIVDSALLEEIIDEENPYDVYFNDKVLFYNFLEYRGLPDKKHQRPRFSFWISENGFYHRTDFEEYIDTYEEDAITCLTPYSENIKRAVFRIESERYLSLDFAFKCLLESGLGIKYCNMCNCYRWNDFKHRYNCILYKKFNTPQFPRLSVACDCCYFEPIKYEEDINMIGEDYRITKRK